MNKHKTKTKKNLSVIVGLGRSGIAAAKLLQKEGKEILVIEKSKEEKYQHIAKDLNSLGISVELGKPLEFSTFKPWIKEINDIIISPSIPWDNDTINKLRGLDIQVKGEISIAWERLKDIPWIGITGTNGKTTVTEMLKHVMDKNQVKSEIGGNMGKPASQIALKYLNDSKNRPELLIIEISSYQIESASNISPKIGIWTTFTADHLERHKTMENYFNIKKSLLDKSSIRIYNFDDKYLHKKKRKLSEGIWISSKSNENELHKPRFWIDPEGIVCDGKEKLFNSSILQIPGEHNLQNLLMVTAAAISFGLTPKEIERSVTSFKGVNHRLEYLGKINNVKFFNDSKATNYASASIGLKALSPPSIVLAGGEAKKGDYTEWVTQLKEKTSGIFLFGSSAMKLKEMIISSNYIGPISIHRNLEEASYAATKMGLGMKSTNILLSPACASFDQYKDFEERGNHFKQLFARLKSEKS
tara:strand:- start:3442 stop:4857 length:1416 start_codon:yes stop_codon:yes gene_type:complete